jgi:hypothetical protein
MWFFDKKKVSCAKGTWTKVISNFGRGYPQDFRVAFQTKDGKPVSGSYQEKRYFWIFPQSPIEGTLETKMTFHRRWINGIYSVKVRTDADAEALINY